MRFVVCKARASYNSLACGKHVTFTSMGSSRLTSLVQLSHPRPSLCITSDTFSTVSFSVSAPQRAMLPNRALITRLSNALCPTSSSITLPFDDPVQSHVATRYRDARHGRQLGVLRVLVLSVSVWAQLSLPLAPRGREWYATGSRSVRASECSH